MLNKSHPLSRYKAKSGENKKIFGAFDLDASVFVLSNWHKIQLLWQIFFSDLSQLWLGPIDCMILMKEYVSMTTAVMKMDKRDFYSDHSNGC